MSLVSEDQRGWLTCFPRVSGDEPLYEVPHKIEGLFSPRERG